MLTFKKEIQTILAQLMGSPWATHPRVQEVIEEYRHLEGAAKTPTQARRVSLQIFHASRAIDTFLAHIATHESGKPGRTPATGYFTLGSSIAYIATNTVGGVTFSTTVRADLRALTTDRNQFLHRANVFPADGDMRRFLMRTINALQEAATFPP